MGRHRLHEIARRGRQTWSAPPSSSTSSRKWTGGATGKAAAPRKICAQMRMRLEKEQGAGQSAESRPGRLLRHRFLADVPAAEGRRHFLQSAEHARAHRHHRSRWAIWSAPTPSSCATPPRSIAPWITACASTPDTPKAACRIRDAAHRADRAGASLDSGAPQQPAFEDRAVENSESHARDFRPAVRVISQRQVSKPPCPRLAISQPETR